MAGVKELTLAVKDDAVVSVKVNIGKPCFEAEKIPAEWCHLNQQSAKC
jgi:hypothetical protein